MKTTGTVCYAGAHVVLADLLRIGVPAAGISEALLDSNGWRVTVRVEPSTKAKLRLTECQRDILLVLRDREYRETTSRVLALLDKHGKVHGEATVKFALAWLVKEGLLSNNKVAPRGYAVAADAFDRISD